MSKHDRHTDEELFREYAKTKDVNIRNKLIRNNEALVTYIVNKYYSSRKEHQERREDLLQEGKIGLLAAIDGFDVERGYRFSTYACVPTSTQILTKRGWKYYDELEDGDETLGYNNGKTEWTKINGIAKYHNAPQSKLGNEKWEAVCTPQHKWLVASKKDVTYHPDDSRPIRNVTLKPLTDIEVGDTIVTSVPIKRNQENKDAENLFTDVIGEQIKFISPYENGEVWCPNTGLGTWAAKDENGRVFLTGNTWWIRQAVNNYLINVEPMIHVPSHVRTQQNKVLRELKKDDRSFQNLLEDGTDSIDIEVSDKMLKSIQNAFQSRQITSIDQPVSNGKDEEDGAGQLKDIIPEDKPGLDILHDKTKLVEVFKKGLQHLSDRERNIILLRFDVIDENEVTSPES